jgi:hypothetical protein
MSTRFRIASLLFMMTHAVVMGAGIVMVLLVPKLAAQAWTMIPAVVVASGLIAAPVSWRIAGRLNAMLDAERAKAEAARTDLAPTDL